MRTKVVAFGLAVGLISCTSASASELRLLAPLAVKGVLGQLIPEFEKGDGLRIMIETAMLPQVAQKAVSGNVFDMVIAPAATVEELRADGIL